MKEAPGFGRAALHLGGLWALAFAQPLFDLLGRNAQFFVARDSTRLDLLILALGYAFVPPLLAAALVWALGRVRPVLGRALLLALVGLLAAALVLPPLGRALGGSTLAVPIAGAFGAAAAVLYARAAPARAFLTVLSPAPVLVVLLFLLGTPVRELVLPGEAVGSVAGPAASSTPIVQVVIDELPETTIDTGDGAVDARHFPSLARFARDATWYRNATTVDDLTAEAVPAQLTGELPEPGDIPTTRDHPRSLFTLFRRSHELTVVEPITDLCPERLCAKPRLATGARLDSLRSDLTIVAEHLLLPADLRDGLPRVDGAWEDFDGGTTAGDIRGGDKLMPDVLARLAANDSAAGFERAIAALRRPHARPPLIFLHSTLPHGPWRHLPDGREYVLRQKAYPGLEDVWGRRQWLIDQALPRHVMQAAYVDRLLGRLLAALRASGLYDDAVVVVSADHGMSLLAGEPRRRVTQRNLPNIAPVPLFVKLPGQRRGRVDERAVRTVDVLPTIAAAAGVRLPWRVDGRPAAERPLDVEVPIAVSHSGVPTVRAPLRAVLAGRRAREREEARLLRDGLFGVGPRPDLLGRPVDPAERPPAGGPRATVDGARDCRAVDARAPVLPLQVAGRIEGLPADTPLAVAVNGRVAATTRVYPGPKRLLYTALVPPGSLRDGPNALSMHEVLAGDELRLIGRAGTVPAVRTAAAGG